MQNIDWETIYSVVLYVVKHYPLTIILYVLLCFVIGIAVSIILTLAFRKYKVTSREHKYYNWIVKLYFPTLFVINIIFSLKIGLFWGVYEALKKESHNISSQVYHAGSSYIFKDEQSKKEFIGDLRTIVTGLSQNNQDLKVQVKDIVKAYDIKNKVIDQPKNWIASLFAEKYIDRIHTIVLYGMMSAVPHVSISESLSYKEFDKLADKLVMLDSKNIEESLIEKIQNLFLMVLKSQFKPIIKGVLLIWGLLMLIPWIELVIYRFIMKRKQSNTIKI
ncbi:hypothetical protein LF887_23695 [Chryseobacterium sp. MEBOG06]|uniref:hypothetical protein n=1 Tax=Chryseobacterium sp. MEBOG06 TaxID=2879938 RepID=UPI001F481E94|nr:hypothetical protein [Chryseobacterium sp. MEBOG06]UKB83963.1 hypothetical protein LF887_23695 [Chryseobacterium sp. MEBOG06]